MSFVSFAGCSSKVDSSAFPVTGGSGGGLLARVGVGTRFSFSPVDLSGCVFS